MSTISYSTSVYSIPYALCMLFDMFLNVQQTIETAIPSLLSFRYNHTYLQ